MFRNKIEETRDLLMFKVNEIEEVKQEVNENFKEVKKNTKDNHNDLIESKYILFMFVFS